MTWGEESLYSPLQMTRNHCSKGAEMGMVDPMQQCRDFDTCLGSVFGSQNEERQ